MVWWAKEVGKTLHIPTEVSVQWVFIIKDNSSSIKAKKKQYKKPDCQKYLDFLRKFHSGLIKCIFMFWNFKMVELNILKVIDQEPVASTIANKTKVSCILCLTGDGTHISGSWNKHSRSYNKRFGRKKRFW